MAKAKVDKKKLTPEEKAKEKERQKRLKEEEKELKKKAKEKEKRKKEREKQRRKIEKKEERRIKRILNFPFKTLFFSSTLISTIVFVMMYFGSKRGIDESIYFSAMLFTFLFLSIGVIMVGGFYVISEEKIRLMKLERKKEVDAEKERIAKEEEELEKLLQAELDELEMEKSKSGGMSSNLLEGGSDEDDDEEVRDASYSPSDDLDSQFFSDEDFTENMPTSPSSGDEPKAEDKKDEEDDEDQVPQLGQASSAQDMPDFAEEMEREAQRDDNSESPEPFFSEEDFMNDVVFGSKE